MAWKNSQQKNGVDCTLRIHKKRGAETQSASRGKVTESKIFLQEISRLATSLVNNVPGAL